MAACLLLAASPLVVPHGVPEPSPDTTSVRTEFSAAVPSGILRPGEPVELIASLKVTTSPPQSRAAFLQRKDFDASVRWWCSQGTFRTTESLVLLGDDTQAPQGLVFVYRKTFVPAAGPCLVRAMPACDPAQSVQLAMTLEAPPAVFQAIPTPDPRENPRRHQLSIRPSATTVGAGQRVQFQIDPDVSACTWTASGGEIDENGLYLAPLTFGTFQITAQSPRETGLEAMATVTVTPPSLLMIHPEEATLNPGQSCLFQVTGAPDGEPIAWTVHPPGAGTFTDEGLFTAGPRPGECSIMALSEDMSAVVPIHILETRVVPDTANLGPGETIALSLQGLRSDLPVAWGVDPPQAGSIDDTGRFTAGRNPGTCRAVAYTPLGDHAATIRILALRIVPGEALVAPGDTLQLVCESTEGPVSLVEWRLEDAPPGARLSARGLFQAPLHQGTCRVSATDSAGNRATATLTVGPPSGLVLSPEIRVDQHGFYTVSARLRSRNGNIVDASSTRECSPGLAYPEIVFTAFMLQSCLQEDGPYLIERLTLSCLSGDKLLVLDQQENLGMTLPFAALESSREWIQIGHLLRVAGMDADDQGRFRILEAAVPVTLATGGDYRVFAVLATEDGREIEAISEVRALPIGAQEVRLRFNGSLIRASGADGPLSLLQFTLEGPAVRSRDFTHELPGIQAWRFAP